MALVESIRDELVRVFTPPQADALVTCFTKSYDALATRTDVHDLRVAMTQLAEQQKETSAEVRALAEQQKETSREMGSLAEQQRETSHKMGSLAEQQRETSHKMGSLADVVRTLALRTNTTAECLLEWLVGEHLPAYVGRRIRRCRIVGVMDVIELLEQSPAAASLTRGSQVGDWSIFRLKNLTMQTHVPRKHGPVPLKSGCERLPSRLSLAGIIISSVAD